MNFLPKLNGDNAFERFSINTKATIDGREIIPDFS